MGERTTRDALLEEGARLFARFGPSGVTARQLHEAAGARNESALHYHFGGRDGLVAEILRIHLTAVEERRASLAASIAADGLEGDVRTLVSALVSPMAVDLSSALGRAHLRLVAHLSHPALAYEPAFRVVSAPAGSRVARWLWSALSWLPRPIRTERVAALRSQLITSMGLHAQLLDDDDGSGADTELFLANLVDMLVAALEVEPSKETMAAASAGSRRR
jgi:AcrR family transcriptional regulator